MKVYKNGFRYSYKYRRKEPYGSKAGAVFLCVLIICGMASFFTVVFAKGGGRKDLVVPAGVPQTGSMNSKPVVSAPGKVSHAPASSAAIQSKAPVSSKPKPSSVPPRVSSAGEESPDLSADFFKDAVFIGDSRTEALQTYGVMKSATYYTMKGLMVSTIFTKPAVHLSNGNKVTIIQALEQNKFGKVYLMLGVNELGWSSSETFVKRYGDVLDCVKKSQPNAQIYVESILPVSEKKSESDKIYNNVKIQAYNQMLEKLANQKGVYYSAVDKALMGPNGALPPDASNDGVHPNKEYCKKWIAYLQQHSANK